MMSANRNLLVLLKSEFMSESAIEQEVECLNNLLVSVESPEIFCNAHELVDRNGITSKASKIYKESRNYHLRAFRFLINKN